MFAPEMQLSLAGQSNEGQGRQSSSNMARCPIGSRLWRRARAFEEAGVRGKIGARSIGNFRYKKTADENGAEADCEVKVFPLLVTRQSAAWPEHGQRVVQWV